MTLRTIPAVTDLAESYFRYATYTVLDRALPDVRDGLKPVHRRILYAMHDMGLRPGSPYKKSARIVGEVLGKYHPHGDMSVYDAMARMTQNFSLLHPLVDGQGNFGSIDGDSPAAMRYTEARLAPIAEEMLADIQRGTVDWMPNFDDSLVEPELLPAVLPNLLVNGASGIAVGMATNIPPHNLGEVCQAVVLVVDRWKRRKTIKVDDLMMAIKGPDFPTGGIVYRYSTEGDGPQVDVIRQAYATGRGRMAVQGRVDIEDIGGGKRNIVISQLPFDQHGAVKKGPFIEKAAQQVRDGRIAGVTDLRDESDHEGTRIVVEVSRAADAEEVLDSLLRYTPLRGTFGAMMLALVPNPDYDADQADVDHALSAADQDETRLVSKTMPRYLALKDMLIYFVEHRLNVIVRRSRHELSEREQRLHIVDGLLIALAYIDRVIAIIRKSRTSDTARRNLMKEFNLTGIQARAILDMQLRRLAAMERTNLEKERKELVHRIAFLRGLLKSEAKRLRVVKEETLAIQERYAQPRRTLILDREREEGVATVTDLLAPEGPQVVSISTKGILYRMPASQASVKQTAGSTSRAVESPLWQISSGPTDTVLLVTSRGRAWRGPVGRIPEQVPLTDFGLSKGETIAGGGIVRDDSFLTLVATNGKVKRTALSDLARGEGIWQQVMGGLDGEQVIAAGTTTGQADVMLFTRQGKAIRFGETTINPQASGSATGVAAIKLGRDDEIIVGSVVEPVPARSVIVVSEHGWIKRVQLNEFPTQGRGGGGVQVLKITPVTGPVAAAAVGYDKGSLNVLSAIGKRHHFKMRGVPVSNRVNRGKQLVDFGDDDTIATLVAFEP